MPYAYLEDIATADVAFKAWGGTLEEMFLSAAEATMNVMVGDLGTIDTQRELVLRVRAESLEMLLFELLQELIYHKDADQLLLRLRDISVDQESGHFNARAEAFGETLDPRKHELNADVKAVTMHRFRVSRTEQGWEATAILDI